MKTSENGLKLIKDSEGLRLTAYYDSGGVITIGYGHTNDSDTGKKYPVYEGETITQAKAEQILKEDISTTENYIDSLVKVSITQNQFDALVSFTFNLGVGTLENSDLLAKLNKKDYKGAANEFGRYVHGGGVVLPGLVTRRRKEAALFLDGSPTTEHPDDTSQRAINAMIQWMKDREGKVTYSMTSRNGPNSYDCSSAVYHALVAGGFLPAGSNGNTDTLFNDLERNGWSQLSTTNGRFDTQRGDVFIWGIRGNSTGSFGHTGIFVDGDNIIHCNYGYNGITTNNHDVIWHANEEPNITIYRYSGEGVIVPNKKPGTSTNGLIPANGIFSPTIKLPVSADTNPNSPDLAYYSPGSQIIYDSYLYSNGYVWISYIATSGIRRYVAVGPDDGRTDTIWGYGFFNNTPNTSGVGNRVACSGVFHPIMKLPVSADTLPNSPNLAYYDAGSSIPYDSYVIDNGYIWISYIAASGIRRYVAVGPNDGNAGNIWGTGFLNNVPGGETTGRMIPLHGVFHTNVKLPVSGDTLPNSPNLAYYDAGSYIIYDSYIFDHGYIWISYISTSGNRRYVAIGLDNNSFTTWGTGFFSTHENVTQGSGGTPTLIAHYGTFTPNIKLPVSADTNPNSPNLDYYEPGMSVNYDSYICINGYVWISYLATSGSRRYIAIGRNTSNLWGTGFYS